MRRISLSPLAIAAAALALTGIAMRINNAFRYPPNMGFDAKFNWLYVEQLMSSWVLPAPDEAWATAHPPLFYYLSAALCRVLGQLDMPTGFVAVRLLSSAVGLATVVFTVLLVRRVDPGNSRRALLAGGLLLFLPVHIYMSAMLNEEILASSLTSIAVIGVAFAFLSTRPPRYELRRALAVGLAAGLALLTKLSGALIVVAAAGAYGIRSWRQGDLRQASSRIAAVLAISMLVGGWYYMRNWIQYGYLYPQQLSTHEIMFSMPPGERNLGDYLRVPLATWTDPQLLAPDLLKSVWGSTYVTVWFDGHRFFLPKSGADVRWAGMGILLLALLPTAAFAIGLGRGIRRAVRYPEALDTPLVLLTALTLAGYVLFTWRNPWFAAVKGSYLLGLSVPFAFYASEVLADWTRGSSVRSRLVWGLLGLLVFAVSATFTYGPVIAKYAEYPGLEWR